MSIFFLIFNSKKTERHGGERGRYPLEMKSGSSYIVVGERGCGASSVMPFEFQSWWERGGAGREGVRVERGGAGYSGGREGVT